MKNTIKLPALTQEVKSGENRIGNLLVEEVEIRVEVNPYKYKNSEGYLLSSNDKKVFVVLTKGTDVESEFKQVLKIPTKYADSFDHIRENCDKLKWERHPLYIQKNDSYSYLTTHAKKASKSFLESFTYREELKDEHGVIIQYGLRNPQIGAIHSILAHWSISNDIATVVIPTGVGKTEVMLSLLAVANAERIIVIVPTDALREQIANKFLTWGMLKKVDVVNRKVFNPCVGILKHRLKTLKEVDTFFDACNVVVTTINIVGQAEVNVQARIALKCSHLFIDEAHHSEAKTWKEFRSRFKSKKIVQFTATPFRADKQAIEGKTIFNYPLKKAQEEHYFKPIEYIPISEYDPNKRDEAIAQEAVSILRKDREKYNHILMARVRNVKRAEQVFDIYSKYEDLNPVQIHTGMSGEERESARRKILSKEAKIIVCVDMLGEGFDLPELKVAAFHDVRKSLPITLQIIGRFTRFRSDLGTAKAVVNVADVELEDELRDLYAQDSDWNILLPLISHKVNKEQQDLWEFLEGFKKFPNNIPLQNIKIPLSTLVYKTTCKEWSPNSFSAGIDGIDNLAQIYHDVNQKTKTLVIVTGKTNSVEWGNIDTIFELDWEIYILFWDKKQKLLFIYGSSSKLYSKLARAVTDADTVPLYDMRVFRAFHKIDRLKLNNVGLKQQAGKLISFIMRMGHDVKLGMSEVEKSGGKLTNIFGVGYNEEGAKTSIGASFKGKIWSYRKNNLKIFTDWCSRIGSKMLDEDIDPFEVLRGTLIPEIIDERPQKVPFYIDWPEVFYNQNETKYIFSYPGFKDLYTYDLEIEILNRAENGALSFKIFNDQIRADYELNIFANDEKGFEFRCLSEKEFTIKYGNSSVKSTDFFYDLSPIIWFVDGSSLEGNEYISLKKETVPYPIDSIQTWNWEGVDIRKESQKLEKRKDSIQYKVIENMMEEDYDVIFDDDSSGELADVVTIKETTEYVEIGFYHCKYSSKDDPGARTDDLYVVCGQAQRSVNWMTESERIITHLIRREGLRKENTRFERGELKDLETFKIKCRFKPIKLHIYIVQPGLSKSKVSIDQLILISVTENYLKETYKVPFTFVGSL